MPDVPDFNERIKEQFFENCTKSHETNLAYKEMLRMYLFSHQKQKFFEDPHVTRYFVGKNGLVKVLQRAFTFHNIAD